MANQRRMAICAFADTALLPRLTKTLQAEKVALSTLASGEGAGAARIPLPVFAEIVSGQSGWADFLETVRRQTSPAIALRLAGELAAGRCLLVILLDDAPQETRIIKEILAGGALSVQIHDLSI
jgi:hypothetical protein